MKRIMGMWGLLAVMGITLVGGPVPAEDQPPAPSAVSSPRRAKIGDEVVCAIDGMSVYTHDREGRS